MASREWVRQNRAPLLLLAGLTLIGLAFRLPGFNDALFGDEVGSYFVVNRGFRDMIAYAGSELEGNPPLFFILAWITKGLGDPAESIRVFSMLAGVATIPLTYVLGALTVGRRAALLGSALVALSPFLIFFSSEARAYPIVVFVCLLSSIALVRAVETGRTAWWIAYGLTTAAAVYTQYLAVFVLLAQLLWALYAHRSQAKSLLLATAGAVVIWLPWLPQFLEDKGGTAEGIERLAPFTIGHVKDYLAGWSIGHPVLPTDELPGDLAVALFAAGLAIAAVALTVRLRRDDESPWPPPDGVLLVVALALATPVGVLLYSLGGNSLFLPRNLIASWPGFALAVGALVTAAPGRARIMSVCLVISCFAIGAVKMLEESSQRPGYRGAAELIEREGEPGDPVVDVSLPASLGPETALERALADPGEFGPAEPIVFSIGRSTLASRLEAFALGPPSKWIPRPIPPNALLAAVAADIADDTGRLFIVTSGHSPEAVLRNPISPAAPYLAALPPGFRLTDEEKFPGFTPDDVTVYLFSRP